MSVPVMTTKFSTNIYYETDTLPSALSKLLRIGGDLVVVYYESRKRELKTKPIPHVFVY